jgi:hypothetical protein
MSCAAGLLVVVLVVGLGVLLWCVLVIAARAERDAERREREAKDRRCSVADLDQSRGKRP